MTTTALSYRAVVHCEIVNVQLSLVTQRRIHGVYKTSFGIKTANAMSRFSLSFAFTLPLYFHLSRLEEGAHRSHLYARHY